jgi:hypothetical protein
VEWKAWLQIGTFATSPHKEDRVTYIPSMSRDGSSGGVVFLGLITEDGIECLIVLSNDLPRFHKDGSF